ncbi:41411_t:CDS:2 [Gigaspora margarita]|uniref:41411_t:CDS:1 n=1 Tax=Gigaspora margarita TaxID=4874 RepID=A0ABN7UUV5_GIGMA|nr:41411_t:CDS:2 [Gigaspora margarita]
MTRKNQTPKEFLLTILNEHIKFLKRLKNKIPKQYHNYIEEEENRTRSYHANVTKKVFTDYDTLKNEFEKVKKTFNKKIKTLEREIRKLNGVIRKKDKDIEMLQSENEKLEEAINTQAQDIIEKDQQIEELEDKMEGLRFENSSLNIKDVEIQKVEIKKTWNDILDNTDVLLAIISFLSPKDLFYLMRIQKYQIGVLKMKHPSIFTDQNFNDILSRTSFLIPDSNLSLNDFSQCIRSF